MGGGQSVDIKLPRMLGKLGRTSSLTEFVDWTVDPEAAYETSACFARMACNSLPQQIATFFVPKLPDSSEYRGFIRIMVHVMEQDSTNPKVAEVVLNIGDAHEISVEEHGLYDWTNDIYTFTGEVQTQLQTASFPWCCMAVFMQNPAEMSSYAQVTGSVNVTCMPVSPE